MESSARTKWFSDTSMRLEKSCVNTISATPDSGWPWPRWPVMQISRSCLPFRELRRGLIPARLQFGGVQFGNHLAGFERVAFLRQSFLNAPAVARGDVDFVRIDRS